MTLKLFSKLAQDLQFVLIDLIRFEFKFDDTRLGQIEFLSLPSACRRSGASKNWDWPAKMGSLTELEEYWGSLKYLEVPVACVRRLHVVCQRHVCRWHFLRILIFLIFFYLDLDLWPFWTCWLSQFRNAKLRQPTGQRQSKVRMQ